MRGYNKAIICGNVGGEPIIHQSENGNKVVEISIATNEGGYKNTQGVDVPEVTQWHRIKLFGKLAETASKYVTKATCVLVEGRINYRKYVDKENNQRIATEIVAERLELIGKVESATDDAKTRENEKEQEFRGKVQQLEKKLDASVTDLPF